MFSDTTISQVVKLLGNYSYEGHPVFLLVCPGNVCHLKKIDDTILNTVHHENDSPLLTIEPTEDILAKIKAFFIPTKEDAKRALNDLSDGARTSDKIAILQRFIENSK